jgi:hypothetical protein
MAPVAPVQLSLHANRAQEEWKDRRPRSPTYSATVILW